MRRFDHRSGTTLTIDGAAIYHEAIGDPAAPALLLLHGGLKDLEDFNAVLPRLEGSFRVVGIDSRGHGRSTAGSDALTYRRLEDDVLAIADHVGLDRFSLVGFSDGGIVGLRLAARHDSRVDRLVTVGSRWTFRPMTRRAPSWRPRPLKAGSASSPKPSPATATSTAPRMHRR